MSDTPVYAAALKRVPTQDRSIRRVDALLDAAADLLRDREPGDLAVRDIAGHAGLPTGTMYQFFDDKTAVFQALGLRFLASLPGVLDQVSNLPGGDWAVVVDGVVDAYADMFREHPAIRRLWLSGVLDAATRQAERDTDAAIAEHLGRLITTRARAGNGTALQWGALVALIDGLLRHAFTEDPDGDPGVLEETRRAARAYTQAVLTSRSPPSR